MKNSLLALALLISNSVFAAAPGDETARVARVMVHIPEIVQQLHDANTDSLRDVQITETQHGVTDYVLTFERSCFCLPATATVTVNEDLRPTFSDGAPIYKSSVEIKKQR